MGAFVEELEKFFNGKVFTASDILKEIREVEKYDGKPTDAQKSLREAIPDGILDRNNGNPNRILGNGLQRFKGKIFDKTGRHLVYAGKDARSKVAQWKIERPQIMQVTQISGDPQEFFSSTTALAQLHPTIEEEIPQKKVTQGATNLHNLCNLHGEPPSLAGRGEREASSPDVLGDDKNTWLLEVHNTPTTPVLDDFDPFLDPDDLP